MIPLLSGIFTKAPIASANEQRTNTIEVRRKLTVKYARNLLGVPYVFGGLSSRGVDCSGLTAYVYKKVGIRLPHYAASQWLLGKLASRNHLKPGDLVFFNHGGHVGLYAGSGKIIHASSVRGKVVVSNLNNGWFTYNYDGAKRLLLEKS